MTEHTIKGLRAEFKAQGKFHTPPELARFLRGLIPGEPVDVYDPTCGAGALLAEFPDAEKYGQDIDAGAVTDAEYLSKFHGVVGDVLTDPAWLDRKFQAIVANPPFSIEWTPNVDERFMSAPTVPTKGRADFAFLLHILYMLADDGVAAVLQFPGICYRGNRELTLRKWMVENNWVDQVIHIPGDTFTDTAISTVCLVFRKNRTSDTIRVVDREHGLERDVPIAEIASNGFNLAPSSYVQPEVVKEVVDPIALEMDARRLLVSTLRSRLAFSRFVAETEHLDFEVFRAEVREVVDAA